MSYIKVLRKGTPFTAQYAEKYGVDALASTFDIPSKYKSPEDLYKECIQKNKRWEDIIPAVPKDALL